MNAFDLLVGKQRSSQTSEENNVIFEQRKRPMSELLYAWMDSEAVECIVEASVSSIVLLGDREPIVPIGTWAQSARQSPSAPDSP